MKTMDCEFTAIIEKRGGCYVGTVEEIPGVNSQGRTLVELRRNLKEPSNELWNRITRPS